MIYDSVGMLLAAATNGISPTTREALSLISHEMLPDEFTRHFYDAVMQLDKHNVTTSLDAIEKQSKLEFFDIASFTKQYLIPCDPLREAKRIRTAYNDMKAISVMNDVINTIQSGRVFNRHELSTALSGLSADIATESESKPVFMSEYVEGYMDILDERVANPGGNYLDIGLDVDINKTDLVVLGGQPGMGKTALAIYINDVVARQGKTCLLFSLEMEGCQLFERQVGVKSNVSSKALKRVGTEGLQDHEWNALAPALDSIKKMKVAIDDDPKLSIPTLISKCRKFKEDHPDLALITVDYLTLMELPSAGNQTLAVAEATRQLKILAKELKTPVLILSQLNREAAKAKREPMNSDLRDSGAIEQDADKIIFPYREEVHDENSQNKGLAKILKTKVRDGETGSYLLGFKNGGFCEPNGGWTEQEVKEENNSNGRPKFY